MRGMDRRRHSDPSGFTSSNWLENGSCPQKSRQSMFDSSHHGGIATAVGVNSVASAILTTSQAAGNDTTATGYRAALAVPVAAPTASPLSLVVQASMV
jgi:hypothetical protein